MSILVLPMFSENSLFSVWLFVLFFLFRFVCVWFIKPSSNDLDQYKSRVSSSLPRTLLCTPIIVMFIVLILIASLVV